MQTDIQLYVTNIYTYFYNNLDSFVHTSIVLSIFISKSIYIQIYISIHEDKSHTQTQCSYLAVDWKKAVVELH